MSTAVCFYHSDRQAVDKCERCGRMVCLEDKIKKNYTRSVETGDTSDFYTYTVILCPMCDMNQEIKSREHILSPGKVILSSIFLIVPFIIGMSFIAISLFVIDQWVNNSPAQGTSAPFQSEMKTIILVFMIPFLLIGIVVAIFVPIFLIIRARKAVKENPAKLKALKQKKRNFIESITSTEARNMFMNAMDETVITCFQCGAKILPHEEYCSNCGDSTKEELKSAGY